MTSFLPEIIVGGLFTSLLGIAGYFMRRWSQDWETRLIARDSRLDEHAERLDKHGERHAKHDTKLAVLNAKLENIETTTHETSVDVKQLLVSHGLRSQK